jgi:hypothetical protein
MKKTLTYVGTVFASFVFAIPMSVSASTVVYNNIPDLGNVPSVGFEATSAKEFGGQIQLVGTDRNDPTVTVLMSSWGCQSGHWNSSDCSTSSNATFSHPITLNIYNVTGDNTPGSLITTITQTFDIPFRPSADSNCTGGDVGKWYDGSTCYNGLATPISFNLTGITLPDKVIVSIAYNTTHYGDFPVGESASCYTSSGGCGYDSLNVGTYSSASVGSYPLPADAYQSSTWSGAYCDNGTGGTGSFRLDAGCWTGFQPAVKIEASAPVVVMTTVVSGGGNISTTGGKAAGTKLYTFSVEIKVDEDLNESGTFTLVKHSTKTTCNYDEISDLVIEDGQATFKAGGSSSCPDVMVVVDDNGEPGAGIDKLSVSGTTLSSTSITGGNFEVESLPEVVSDTTTFTASNSLYYNCPTVCESIYGNGPISFTWDTDTGNVMGGLYEEIVPPTSGTHYLNDIIGGTVSGSSVHLNFHRTADDYSFTADLTLTGNTLTGTLAGPYYFTATGVVTP